MADKKNEEDKLNNEPKKRERPKKVPEQDIKQEKPAEKKPKKGGVGGNGNLIPLNQRTMEERSRIGTKAGVASGVARRRKKELREFTRDFLMQEAAGPLKQNLNVLGVDQDQMTNLAAMVIRLFSKAVNQGDLNAARTIIEWAGMAPLQQERENEAIARMSQIVQMADTGEETKEEEETVVFYIPDNGRGVVRGDGLVTVEGEQNNTR